ncbi:hypothetical protein KAZ93_05275 [Patescibacteria group bacterium]|nr:hypothetical protein [Patescibacteria group bacterium]
MLFTITVRVNALMSHTPFLSCLIRKVTQSPFSQESNKSLISVKKTV